LPGFQQHTAAFARTQAFRWPTDAIQPVHLPARPCREMRLQLSGKSRKNSGRLRSALYLQEPLGIIGGMGAHMFNPALPVVA